MSVAALGLLRFVPDLIGLFDKDKSVVEKVAGIAKSITGAETVDQAEQALVADPALAYQFKLAVMENETVLEKLDEQSRQRASEQYSIHNEQADKIADSIMSRNLPTVFALVVINAVVVYLFTHYAANQIGQVAIISNLIGVVIGSLIQERQQVVSFFFGSSLGTKLQSVLGSKGGKNGS